METKELISKAQNKEFTAFDKLTKDTLKVKVAQKLAEKGYFSRLDQAKGINEENDKNVKPEISLED